MNWVARLSNSRAIERFINPAVMGLACIGVGLWIGCAENTASVDAGASSDQNPGAAIEFDVTEPKPVEPRDRLERIAMERGADLRLVDRMMDRRTEVPDFERRPLPKTPPERLITDGVTILDDSNPFPEVVPIPSKEVTLRVGIGRSTYRSRTRREVLSAVQPFIDLVQREVNIRGAPDLYETAEEMYFGLLDGKNQLIIAHVFDYLMIRNWLAGERDNATVLLAWARPANPRTTDLDRDLPGVTGTSIELIVAADAAFKTPADLKGARLAVAVHHAHGPGAFLTRMLADLGHPPAEPFFSRVTLRLYPKDAVIDVIKGKAEVACVDQGTVAALESFYGLGGRIRTLAVSPRYNVDVLFTSLNNVATHRTQIELTQNQLTTLGKDPEGQEVLFFFDTERWQNHRDGDIDVPLKHFADYLKFIDETPVDLKPLLDPKAPVDRRTYGRYGDE